MGDLDIDHALQNLRDGKILTEKHLRAVCDKVKEIFLQEPNLTPVRAPVTLVGDIHGQFYDFLELLKKGGEPPATNYVFMGDYVDRGHHSVETIEYLLLLKIKYPSHITVIRGNHESRQVSNTYGLYEETNRKYGNPNPWHLFTDVFDHMPISAVVDGAIFCVHGGLSPKVKRLDQINTIDRRMEIPHEGAFCDLMWSDPEEIEDWRLNHRGAGYLFGGAVVKEFNHINGLELVARAHQLVNEGYKFWFQDQNLVTVWSAPNYCYRCGNEASILVVDSNLERSFTMFGAVPDSSKVQNIQAFLPYFL
jgi:serine/threonine-protein phosphatase 6 catalytic subunit